MKPFCFQKFTINQDSAVFRVGTDGVLLGAMCSTSQANNILEVGTGTGLISLMIAQRNSNAQILALDIDINATKLAQKNFQNSIFTERLKVLHQDFKKFKWEEKFDLIVSNPPYFQENPSEKDVLARQNIELDFENLIINSKKNLSQHGVLSVIIPSENSNYFIEFCNKNQLFLKTKINIFGIEGGVLRRNILEFSASPKPLVEDDFIIEKNPRIYSDSYIELTKEFHIFGK